MKKPLVFEVYRSKKEYRWRLKSANGKIIADSAESYKRKSRALKMIDMIVTLDTVFKINDTTEKA